MTVSYSVAKWKQKDSGNTCLEKNNRQTRILCLAKVLLKMKLGLPCGPVVKTWCFHCMGSIPAQGTKIPHTIQCGQKLFLKIKWNKMRAKKRHFQKKYEKAYCWAPLQTKGIIKCIYHEELGFTIEWI